MDEQRRLFMALIALSILCATALTALHFVLEFLKG
jgi:hypothetical protein